MEQIDGRSRSRSRRTYARLGDCFDATEIERLLCGDWRVIEALDGHETLGPLGKTRIEGRLGRRDVHVPARRGKRM